MAQLSTIISSILRDMILAQHEANMYAITLSESYRKNGRTENFPLPSIALGEMDLEFRYGVKDVSVQTEQFEINYPELKKNAKELSMQLARVIVSSVVSSVMSDSVGTEGGKEHLINQLSQEEGLRRRFCSYLSRKLLQSMQTDFSSLINEDGTLNADILTKNTVRTGETEFLNHKDLDELLQEKGGDQFRGKAKADMEAAILGIMPQLVKDINFKRKRIYPSMDVIVSSDELAKMPEECIHTFHFKVTPRNLNLNLTDEGNDEINK
jgi:hypothetical protein